MALTNARTRPFRLENESVNPQIRMPTSMLKKIKKYALAEETSIAGWIKDAIEQRFSRAKAAR